MPLTIEIASLNKKIAEALNESSVHPYVKVKVLEDVLGTMNQILEQTYQMEKEAHEKAQQEEEE